MIIPWDMVENCRVACQELDYNHNYIIFMRAYSIIQIHPYSLHIHLWGDFRVSFQIKHSHSVSQCNDALLRTRIITQFFIVFLSTQNLLFNLNLLYLAVPTYMVSGWFQSRIIFCSLVLPTVNNDKSMLRVTCSRCVFSHRAIRV